MNEHVQPQKSAQRGRLFQILAVVGGVLWAFVLFAFWESSDGFIKPLIGLVLLVGIGGFVALFERGKQHLSPDAEEAMRSDPRAPVVYLRSFEDDDSPNNLEWALCDVMDDVGPFVAIGRPGDTIPPLGASRAYIKDKNWKNYVTGLLDRSALVVLLAGRTAGLKWELGQCGRRIDPERVVVLIPKEREAYEQFRTNVQDSGIPIDLPPYPAENTARHKAGEICGLVHFDKDWRGSFIPFERALLKGSSHEFASSANRAGDRLRLALQSPAAAAGLAIKAPKTNVLLIGLLMFAGLALAAFIVLGGLIMTGELE